MRQKSQSVVVYNNLRPLKALITDYTLSVYECIVLRRKFIGVAPRYLYIFPDQVAICKEQRKSIPDRQIPINNDTRVSWTFKAKIKADGTRTLKSVKFHSGLYEFEYLGDDKVMRELRAKLSLYAFQTKIQEEYQAELIIDKGSYATVLELTNIYSKKAFAAKCIDQKKIIQKENAPLQLSYEIQTMRMLSAEGHPNILRLHELYIGNQNFYIVMELAQGGSLLSVMKNQENLFNSSEIQLIMSQLLEGLAYMHSFELMHRDLKPENILFLEKDNLNSLKIADFGLAQSINDFPYIYPKCGTPGFVAPEVLAISGNNVHYGYSCDIFSAGVILYILLTGEPLFDASDRRDLLEMNRRCNIDFSKLDKLLVNDDEMDLLKNMLCKDPIERYTATKCLEHRFFQSHSKSVESWDEFFIENELDLSQQTNIAKFTYQCFSIIFSFMNKKMTCFSKNPFFVTNPKRSVDPQDKDYQMNRKMSMFISSNPKLDKFLVTQIYNENDKVGSFGQIKQFQKEDSLIMKSEQQQQ